MTETPKLRYLLPWCCSLIITSAHLRAVLLVFVQCLNNPHLGQELLLYILEVRHDRVSVFRSISVLAIHLSF